MSSYVECEFIYNFKQNTHRNQHQLGHNAYTAADVMVFVSFDVSYGFFSSSLLSFLVVLYMNVQKEYEFNEKEEKETNASCMLILVVILY